MIKLKQDSQCTYDVTLRRVRATVVVVVVVVVVGKQHLLHNEIKDKRTSKHN